MPKVRKNQWGLTAREERFCQEYVKDLNQVGAYMRAGFTKSRDVANSNATRVMAKDGVKKRIAMLQEATCARLQLSQDRLIEELVRLSFSDMRNYATWGQEAVQMRASSDLSDVQAAAVKRVTSKTTTRTDTRGQTITEHTVSVELHDKLDAMGKLMRHMGIEGASKHSVEHAFDLSKHFTDALAEESATE